MYRNDHYGPIDRFCARHPGFGIPNLVLYIAIGQAAVGLLSLFNGEIISWLAFYGRAVFSGQIWRLVTFVFVPKTTNPFYMLLSCYVIFWTGQMLERELGTAKFNLFYLFGVVLSALWGLLLGTIDSGYSDILYVFGIYYADIYYIHLSIFLIIATLYGEMQVLFMFVIPIKMKWLAVLDVVLVLVDVVQYARAGLWFVALTPLPSFINYFIFTWPFWSMKLGVVKRQADPQVINFKKAQRQIQKKAKETGGYLHKCAVCGVTDAIEPNMEFRYCSKCDGYHCYCSNHINNHVHIRQD